MDLTIPGLTPVETDRLRLRALNASDAGPFLEMHQDPDVIKYITPGTPPGGGITMAWRNIAVMIGHWYLRGYGQWAVVEKATGEVIGRAGLWNPEGWPGIEIGWLIRRSRWGLGFGTEAARAALDWAWTATTADHIISLIQPENTRSIRIAHKLGETFEREHDLNGTLVHVYGIHRTGTL